MTVPFGELKQVASCFDQIIKAVSEDDLVGQTSDFGQLYGLGPDIAQVATRRQDAVLKPDKAAMPAPTERDQLRLQAVADRAQETEETREQEAVTAVAAMPSEPAVESAAGDEDVPASQRTKPVAIQQPQEEAKASQRKSRAEKQAERAASKRQAKADKSSRQRSSKAGQEADDMLEEGVDADADFGEPSRGSCIVA